MDNATLFNITPIDGRYKSLTASLKSEFTEYAFIRQRVIIEIKYFIFLLKLNNDSFPYNQDLHSFMENLSDNILFKHIDSIKQIEQQIHHDVKSIEYFLTKQLRDNNFDKYINLLHFGLTSQDVNTTAYSISLHKFKNDIFIPVFDKLLSNLQNKIDLWNNTVIIGRTHGQPATWTILGKEFMVFKNKLMREYNILQT